MEDLTKRQQEILTMIRDFMDDSGFPPTRADICRVMGFNSPNAAEEHLRTLERKGAIEMLAGASRGIRLKQASGLPAATRPKTSKRTSSSIRSSSSRAPIIC